MLQRRCDGFVTRVKPYKVSATYVKNVGEEVYSVGFPVEFLLKYGKYSPLSQGQFPTLQQDNNSNNEWNSLVLNVASWGKITIAGLIKSLKS